MTKVLRNLFHIFLLPLSIRILASVFFNQVSDGHWIWAPQDKTKAAKEVTIVGSVHSNDFFVCWDLEVFPAGSLTLCLVRWRPVPMLVDQVLSEVVQDAQAIDYATLLVLVDVYV